MRIVVGLALAGLVVACDNGSGSGASSPDPHPAPSPERETTPPPDPEGAEARAETDPDEPMSEELDLLEHVATDLAVSSAYRDRASQIAALVDGDLETAWNSRSDDLVGAWIEVRIPTGAQVTGLEMTSGFTHRTARADLFTGNHRVTRVRVTRDGAEVGVYPLDPESREMQRISVAGASGVYRVTVDETQPGTNASWREICISELRVLGRAPTAMIGDRYPRLAMVQLPAPRSDAPPDRAAVLAAHPRAVVAFERAWWEYEMGERRRDATTGGPEEDDAQQVHDLRRQRQSALEPVAAYVESVDAALGDAIRRRIAHPHTIEIGLGRDAERRRYAGEDLDAAARAFDAISAFVEVDAARCRWARAHAGLRTLRLENGANATWYLLEYEAEFGEEAGGSGRRQDRIDTLRTTLGEIGRSWSSNSAGMEPRLRRIDRTLLPEQASDFDALYAALDTAHTACGWR
ncbi:MAG: hypothetical protein AB7S26_05815 [Sandaracinaceae bacterium]